jgi:hypothetical protein
MDQTHTNPAETHPIPARTRRHRKRHRLIEDLDKRSRAGRRAAQLIRLFEAALGGTVTDAQRLAVSRAALMTAIAEDARIKRLHGATDISLDDLVRLDRVAAGAVRALDMPAKPGKPTLSDYLRGIRDGEDEGGDDTER